MKFMLGLSEKHRVYNRSSFPRPGDAPASQKSGVVSAPLKRAFKAGKDLVKRVRKMSSMLSRSNIKAAALTRVQHANNVRALRFHRSVIFCAAT